ncbi:MAG: hypothetical protein ABJA60_11040, partial [Nitrosospira sp.]
ETCPRLCSASDCLQGKPLLLNCLLDGEAYAMIYGHGARAILWDAQWSHLPLVLRRSCFAILMSWSARYPGIPQMAEKAR